MLAEKAVPYKEPGLAFAARHVLPMPWLFGLSLWCRIDRSLRVAKLMATRCRTVPLVLCRCASN